MVAGVEDRKEESNMKVTGKYSHKAYQCSSCGTEKEFGTNHWGSCYPWCNVCNEQTIWKCLEEVPEGYKKPEEWRTVKIGDILKTN